MNELKPNTEKAIESDPIEPPIEPPDCDWFFRATATDFMKIPGNPIAYWVSNTLREIFSKSKQLQNFGVACIGLQTGNNSRFTRQWHEISLNKIGFTINERSETKNNYLKWYPYKRCCKDQLKT